MHIRKLEVSDSAAYLEMLDKLDQETSFMLFEPGERSMTEDEIIARVYNKGSETFVVADEGELGGFISISRGFAKRINHMGYIVMGILKAHQGRGLGTKLFGEAINWAKENGITRLELTVMTHNTAALALYKKMGFLVEGTRKKAMKVEGKYVDEYYMGKII